MPTPVLIAALAVLAVIVLTLAALAVRGLVADLRTPSDRRDIPNWPTLLNRVPPHPEYGPYEPGLTRFADDYDRNPDDTIRFPLARNTARKETAKS